MAKKFIAELKNYGFTKLFLELIVVFLGVTAGFMLNNWKSEEQEKQLERKYLSGFTQDINNNILELENVIKTDSSWLARANFLIIGIKNKNITPDSAEVAINLIVNFSKFEHSISTYKDITNSGNLNILNEFHLKSLIIDYHINIEEVWVLDDFFYKYFSDYVMPFIFSEVNVLTGKLNNIEVIKTTRFSNLIAGYYSLMQQRKTAYVKLLNKSYLLRDEIKKYTDAL